ncbi:MAG: hypothetical protein R2825_02400 [Saprospiraceae bacterium]
MATRLILPIEEGLYLFQLTSELNPINMRFFFTFSFLTALLSSTVNTQVTFNKRFHFDFLGAVATSVLPNENGYVAIGIIADTVAPYNTGNFFAKLDLAGNLLSLKTITDKEKTYETWQNSLTFANDSTLVVSGESISSNLNTLFITYNLEGDTLFTKEYPNPFFPNYTFIQPRGGMRQLPDNGFVIFNWINNGLE